MNNYLDNQSGAFPRFHKKLKIKLLKPVLKKHMIISVTTE